MRKTIPAFTSLLLLVCLIYTLPTAQLQSKKSSLSNGKKDAKNPLQVLVARSPDASKPQFDAKKFAPPSKDEADNFLSGKDKKASKALAFRKFRKMLLDQGVSFEPNLLLENNWKERFKNQLSNVKEMQVSKRFAGGKIKGVIIANNLYLPKETEFSDDTVILANRIIFEGKDVLIKGSHGIAIFSLEDTYLTEPVPGTTAAQPYSSPVNSPEFENEFFARNRILKHTEEEIKPINGRITVNANEIVRTHKNIGKVIMVDNKLIVPAGMITIEVSGYGNKEWKEDQVKKANGQPDNSTADEQIGTTGADGSFPPYPKGIRGADGDDGQFVGGGGDCSANPNGRDGDNGTAGHEGVPGDQAGDDAQIGGEGPPIIQSISGAENAYTFVSKGGKGGSGQAGATGGDGGDGGKGKKGGDGVTCGCTVGSGGKSGDNGDGGPAGSGGKGGNAASGGKGGVIHITYPMGSVSPNVTASSLGGDPGIPGLPGSPGNPGNGFAGIEGGSPGTPSCGIFGNWGGHGKSGHTGSVDNIAPGGNTASVGDPGPDPVIEPESGGGGGGGCFTSTIPGLLDCGGGYCTPYYWVLYYSWDGGATWYQMNSWDAGCW